MPRRATDAQRAAFPAIYWFREAMQEVQTGMPQLAAVNRRADRPDITIAQ
jgi:hypothetical protein